MLNFYRNTAWWLQIYDCPSHMLHAYSSLTHDYTQMQVSILTSSSLLHHSVRRTPTQLLHSLLPFSTRFPLRRPLHWLPAFVLCNHCTVKSTPLTYNSVPTKSTLYAHILLRLLRNRTHIEHVIIPKLPISFDIFLAFFLLPVDGTADPR